MSEARPPRRARVRRRARQFRRRLWKTVAFLVVGSAVVVSIGRLLAPQADLARPLVESWLSRTLDQPVEIGRVEASWPRLSPRIQLHDLRIGSAGQPLLAVERARMEFKLYNLPRPGRNSVELVALGLSVALVQEDSGRWSWQLERGGQLERGWERIVAAGDVVLRDATIRIDPQAWPDLSWTIPEAMLSRTGDRLSVRLEARPAAGSTESLRIRAGLVLGETGPLSADAHAVASGVPVFAILPSAAGDRERSPAVDLEAWLEWNETQGGRVHGRAEFGNGAQGNTWLPGADAADEALSGSRLRLDARWDRVDWGLELNAADGAGRSVADGLAVASDGDAIGVAASAADLGWLHAVLSPWLAGMERWPVELAGHVEDLVVARRRTGGFFEATGRLGDFGLRLARPAAAVSALDADLGLDADRLALAVSGAPVLDLPALYPFPIETGKVGGTVAVSEHGLVARALRLVHPVFEIVVDGRLDAAGSDSVVDLVAVVERMQPDSPTRWLPARGLPSKTRAWLEDALEGLDSAEATVSIWGRPARWKRGPPPGGLHAEVAFRGLDLAYAPGWPGAVDADGVVEFESRSLRARVESGRVAGVVLRGERVTIDDFRDPVIGLELAAPATTASSLSALARAFPLPGGEALERIAFDGGGSARASVSLPLKRLREWSIDGVVRLEAVDVSLPDLGLGLGAVDGELPFSRERLGGLPLAARVGGQDVEVVALLEFGPAFGMELTGELPVEALLPTDPPLRDLLGGAVDGSADWRILVEPDSDGEEAGANGYEGVRVRVVSTLEGVRLDLPAPLSKPPERAWPFELSVPLRDGAGWYLRVDQRVGARIVAGPGRWRAGVAFGDRADGVVLPETGNFSVTGTVPALDAAGWLRLLAAAGMPDEPPGVGPDPTGRIDLEIDALRFGDDDYGRVSLELDRQREYWSLAVDGERVEGAIRLPAAGGADPTLVGDFDRLHLPAAEADADADTERPERPPSSLDPIHVPPFNVTVEDLRFGDVAMGRFRWISHRRVDGLEIEQVSARGADIDLTGSGTWTRDETGIRTQARLRISAQEFGEVLTDAGFDVALQRGQAAIEFDGSWPGSPADFALARVRGELELNITDGVIPAARPGAGRLLGLVSLNSIPRRLRLDFSDVFGDGLGFDRIRGHFTLQDGLARTEDLAIDAPAAEIEIRGITDLVERRYDQELRVRPGVGSTLPIIGALTGGPLGAAAGAALQQILSEPLKGMTEIRYSVTGTWDDPVVQPVEIETVPGDASG
ncbi:MAG: YhdP family protein [Wenzhouxiangellaceae bacterium]|nr:YhdP family protein [Wenzhouxiangellaceae bacterium]